MNMRISSLAMEPAPSTIDCVTVYRRGARVRRVVEVPRGTKELVLGHLPLALDDASIRTSMEGDGVRATDVRIGVAVPPVLASLAPPKDEELRAGEEQTAFARAEVERVEATIARLEMLAIAPRPAAKKGERPPATPVEARLALTKARAAESERLAKELSLRKAELRKAERRLAELRDRAKHASTARNAREHELFKTATVRLEGDGAGRLAIEYVVPGPCWAPAYTLWLDGGSARVAMRALVAQRTGEDWKGAKLVLSTADPDRFAELPELTKLRIGRAQPSRAKRGFREPPEGAFALFADHDRGFGPPGPPDFKPGELKGDVGAVDMVMRAGVASYRPHDAPEQGEDYDLAVLEEAAPETPVARAAMEMLGAPAPQAMRAKSSGLFGALSSLGRGGGPPAPPPPHKAAMPMAAPASLAAPMPPMGGMARRAAMDRQEAEAGEGSFAPSEPTLDIEAMAYGRLRLFGADSDRRGELCAVSAVELYLDGTSLSLDVAMAVRVAVQLAGGAGDELPEGHTLADATDDAFDYAYFADMPCDVPSDGGFHSVPVTEHAAKVRQRHVTVPREASDVFRTVEVESPIDAALLEGPVDVYERRKGQRSAEGTDGYAYVLTATMPSTPPRGELTLGLGVEQGIKVARNTTFAEQSKGLLGGGLALVHEVVIDLSNATSTPVTVEVRERVPVKREDDDDVEIDLGAADPAWKEWDQDQTLDGGRRWIVPLAVGEAKKLRATYTVKIASKNQLVGGNRRES
jgi:hypothetical protein